jgi:hypothetical protein
MSQDVPHAERRSTSLIWLILGVVFVILLVVGGFAMLIVTKQRQARKEQMAAEEVMRAMMQLEYARAQAAAQAQFATEEELRRENKALNPGQLQEQELAQLLLDAISIRGQARIAAESGDFLNAATGFREAQRVLDKAVRQKPKHLDLREQQLTTLIETAEFFAGLVPRRQISYEDRLVAQTLADKAVSVLRLSFEWANPDESLTRIRQVEFATGPEIVPPPRKQ